MKAIFNNGYIIYSDDINLLIELLKNDNIINWFNFCEGSYFYSDNNNEYIIDDYDSQEKSLCLTKCI